MLNVLVTLQKPAGSLQENVGTTADMWYQNC